MVTCSVSVQVTVALISNLIQRAARLALVGGCAIPHVVDDTSCHLRGVYFS
jgi:hypothetical protein